MSWKAVPRSKAVGKDTVMTLSKKYHLVTGWLTCAACEALLKREQEAAMEKEVRERERAPATELFSPGRAGKM